MTYITSIGLDVHARSVSACAFDPFTGEVAQRRFGTDAGEIAEWILSRALDDAREDLQRARRRLSKFPLRRGPVFDETDALGRRRGAWTRAFWRWAESCRPSDPAAAAAFDRYVACVRCAESDKRALEKRVLAEARADRWRGAVEALSCIKGIDAVTAFCLATEARCFSRFPTAGAYASWLGLAPSEHSSGEKEAKGGITKTGNSASRRALVEAAWHFKSCSPKPKAPPAGSAAPAAVKRRCDDAAARLRRGHESLGAAGKRPCVANVAVARELACRVREVGRRAEGALA